MDFAINNKQSIQHDLVLTFCKAYEYINASYMAVKLELVEQNWRGAAA